MITNGTDQAYIKIENVVSIIEKLAWDVWTKRQVQNAIHESCSCGGRGPQDNPCPACMVWHLLNGRQVK